MTSTYHIVQMVPKEKELTHTICALLKKDERVELVGAVLEPCDGHDYLRALGHKVTLWDLLFTEKLMLAETLGRRAAMWYLGLEKPWRFYGAIPAKFNPDDLKPPFNYSLPCEEFYVGRAMHTLHSMEMDPINLLLKKMVTFGDYKSPKELFEAGLKKQANFYTDPQYLKANKNIGFIPQEVSEEDLLRKRQEISVLK